MENIIYSKKDIARILNVSIKTVDRYIKKGELEAIKVGGLIKITNASFQKFIEDSRFEVGS